MHYRPIMSTLGYIMSPDGDSVLMVHRIARKGDEQFGKYNGLGGHMKPDEDIATCMVREIREEAGIEVLSMQLRGTVNWTGFGAAAEDWIAFIFRIERFQGEPAASNEEGPLEWVERTRIADMPMWEGDRLFLPLVFDKNSRPFHGYMPYENGHPKDWSYTRL